MLADLVVAAPRGATWGRDGVILFAPGPSLGIYRVPDTGGTAVSVGSSSDAGASLSMFPSFLPDGRHFLYTSFREREWWINIGSLDVATTTPLLKAFSKAEYANGYLLFGSKGALYAQPFDGGRLALSGERLRVLGSLGQGSGHPAGYAFSSANGVIAAGHVPAMRENQLIWLDQNGTPQSELGESSLFNSLSVAPDRTKAVVVRSEPTLTSFDPWIVNLDSGFASAVRTSLEGSSSVSPVWSADGSRIFFRDDIGLRSLSPSGGVDTVWPMQIHWPLSSSPDGQFLLIMTQSADTGNDLMFVRLTGDHTPVPYLQTTFNESVGRFSPDGRSVAYVSDESSRQEVYVQSFPAAGKKSRISANGGASPQWSDDGTSVYFLSPGPGGKTTMMVAQVQPGGAAPRRLFDMPTRHAGAYSVFDNGRRFLIAIVAPDTAPQVITIGLNWVATLAKGR